MKKFLVFALAMQLAMTLLLASCTEENEEGNVENVTTPAITDTITDSGVEVIEEPVVVEPTYGGTLRIACRDPQTLNPLLNKDKSVDQVLSLINEPLYYLDESYKPVPNLVESVEYVTDSNSIILKLKEEVYFHNESLFTAKDVAFTIDQLKKADETAMYKSLVADIERTSIIDDYNIKIYYSEGLALATYRLTFPIVSQDYFNSDDYNEFVPVGLGGYKFVDFTPMEEMALTVNDNYFGEKPYISNIDVTVTRSYDAEETAFEQKLLDITSPIKFDWLQFAEDGSVTMIEYTTNYFDYLGFNFNNEALADNNVRKAIAYSIDRQGINNEYFLNHGVVTDYITHPNSFYNGGNEVYSYNLDQALSLIQGAPIEDTDGDGYYDQVTGVTASGISLDLLVNSDNSLRMAVAEEIQGKLDAIGLKVTIKSVPKDEFYEKLYAKDFDLVVSGWKLSSVPDYSQLFHSSYIEGGTNFINYNNEMMDMYLESIYTSDTEENLVNNIQAFNDFYVEELPYFSLYFANSTVILNDNVYNELTPTTENNYMGIDNIFTVE